MAAMQNAAKTNPDIATRIDLFRYRVPEEFYNLKNDPDCRHNLIERPELQPTIKLLQAELVAHMTRTDDPMLPAFQSRNDRSVVDRILMKTYGPPKEPRKKKPSKKNRKRAE